MARPPLRPVPSVAGAASASGKMALSEVFADIGRFIKGKGPDGVHIDNHLFQLHYRLTTFIFLGEGVPAKVSRSPGTVC